MKSPVLKKVRYYSTFPDMFRQIAEGRENSPAIHWFTRKGEEKGVTYGTLCEDVRNLRAAFARRGFAKKHLAILGENSYEWLLVYFAATCIGAVVVCVDVEQSRDTIAQMIDMTDVHALFCSPSMEEIGASLTCGKRELFSLSFRSSEEENTVAALLREGAEIRGSGEETEGDLPSSEDTASIVFTSGTTSYAKPVMLSHKAILTNASDALACVAIGDVVFTSLPFYHTYGLTCSVIGELIGGVKIYINGNLKTMMRDLLASHAHTVLTVPLVLEAIHSKLFQKAEEKNEAKRLRFLLKTGGWKYRLGIRNPGEKLKEIRSRCLGTVRLVICGAAHLNEEIIADFTYMGVTVLQGYGITECAPLVSVNRIDANRFDSVGQVMPHCRVKIREGEIFVCGDNVMQGYYRQPELNGEVMQDGWFATGDLGYLDGDGFLHITGRKKNLIVFQNGKKISPEKLEEMLRKIPIVRDVMVYGAESGTSSDDVQVAASVFPDEERSGGLSSYEVLEVLQKEIDRINRDLPLYQQIKMVNIREEEFSKTALQKIKRYENEIKR